jgi:hypothetical protein
MIFSLECNRDGSGGGIWHGGERLGKNREVSQRFLFGYLFIEGRSSEVKKEEA